MGFSGAFVVRLAILLLVSLSLTGCPRTAPVYEVKDRSMPEASRSRGLDEIGTRIMTAGKRIGWSMNLREPGIILGRLEWHGRHTADVAIRYDRRKYSIEYESSARLLAGTAAPDEAYAGEKVIHKRYNRYVRRLEKYIDVELAKTGI